MIKGLCIIHSKVLLFLSIRTLYHTTQYLSQMKSSVFVNKSKLVLP
ncbi:unnamed protein product [Arabidopsis halleri]